MCPGVVWGVAGVEEQCVILTVKLGGGDMSLARTATHRLDVLGAELRSKCLHCLSFAKGMGEGEGVYITEVYLPYFLQLYHR